MAGYLDWVRHFCQSLPHTTEKVRWEHNLLFCVGDRMYCVANLEPGVGPSKITFKCTPEVFAEMIEREGMIPAPYSARNHWVSVTDVELFRQPELKELIRASYELIFDKLPKRLQEKLKAKTGATERIARPSKSSKSKPKQVPKRRK